TRTHGIDQVLCRLLFSHVPSGLPDSWRTRLPAAQRRPQYVPQRDKVALRRLARIAQVAREEDSRQLRDAALAAARLLLSQARRQPRIQSHLELRRRGE